MTALAELGARRMRELAVAGVVSPRELVQAALDRIQTLDGRLGAFLEVEAEWALARADALEAARRRGRAPGPLFGVPVGLKDNLHLAGWRLTCASRILEGYRAPYTATAVQRLLDAGAVPVGRCNMDEFGFGSSTEHSAFQATRNPWSFAHVPGGSSGGSAAAVAARMVPLALGSDTGGSIRLPAALCGVSGLKPTYGRVSRFGLVAFGSSLDQIGPLARSAEDCALALAALAGPDPRDATTLPAAAFVPSTGSDDLAGVRVGIATEFFPADLPAAVREPVLAATRTLAGLGAELREVAVPHASHAIATYYLIATAEASSNLARFDGIRFGARTPATDLLAHYLDTRGAGFGEEAKRRILLGVFCLSAGHRDRFYRKALQVQTLLREDFARAFTAVDVIVGPTAPFSAFRLGEGTADPLALYHLDRLTTPASLAGIPAMSLPCGCDAGGLPVGLQIHGPALGEDRLLRVAHAFQQATSFHATMPRELRP